MSNTWIYILGILYVLPLVSTHLLHKKVLNIDKDCYSESPFTLPVTLKLVEWLPIINIIGLIDYIKIIRWDYVAKSGIRRNLEEVIHLEREKPDPSEDMITEIQKIIDNL